MEIRNIPDELKEIAKEISRQSNESITWLLPAYDKFKTRDELQNMYTHPSTYPQDLQNLQIKFLLIFSLSLRQTTINYERVFTLEKDSKIL